MANNLWNWGGWPWGAEGWGGIWEGLPSGPEGLGRLNVLFPWLQQAMASQQWGQEFDYRKAQDLWEQEQQKQQFAYQKAMDQWSQAFQKEQLGAQQERATMEAYGRRWKPDTRWL